MSTEAFLNVMRLCFWRFQRPDDERPDSLNTPDKHIDKATVVRGDSHHNRGLNKLILTLIVRSI